MIRPSLATLPILGLAWGCDRLPAQLQDCPELACQQRWVTAGMERDPEATLAAVHALPSGLDRETLIQVMMVEWPEHSPTLCAELTTPGLRERCESVTGRPHLWQVDPEKPTQGPVGAGAAYPVLAVEMGPLEHPWNELEALGVECNEAWTRNTCVGRQAVDMAYKFKHKDAWRICLGAEQDKWRYECFFQVSEATWEPHKGGIPELAAQMCLYSGYYQDRCLGHMAGKVGRWAPAASWDAGERWHDLTLAIETIQRTLDAHHPSLGSRWTALAWAYAMDAAYAHVDPPVGNPIDHVGPAAMPHIAASVAWGLWRAQPNQVQSLDAWVDQFESAMGRREVDPGPQPALVEEDELNRGWSDSLPGEEAVEWTVYRGPIGRRAVGKDPRSDAIICVLEAAARNPTPHRASLFREALQHPDPLVRWTAARLTAQRMPAALSGVDPSAESNPLVRARLERALGMGDD